MKLSLTHAWYGKSFSMLALLLLPFSWLFGLCAAARRLLYRLGVFKTYHFNIPVIIVGNITVGGTGKTPFVIWLAKFLQANGYRPGIVSRGVGGRKHTTPHHVESDNLAEIVGDEALLLVKNTNCPVVIAVDRVAAVRKLLKNSNCNIVISDDGLQHYRLGRELEIVMVDGERRFGNKHILPAGPLREPESRLHSADFVVINTGNESSGENENYTMFLEPKEFVSVTDSQRRVDLHEFPRDKIHAVAGIGHPQRFFMTLKNAGFDLVTHAFPDHHSYHPRDLDFADSLNILMTEKDAVKCGSFADERYWYLHVTARINDKLEQALLLRLQFLEGCDEYEKDFAIPACRHTHRVQRDDIRQQNGCDS